MPVALPPPPVAAEVRSCTDTQSVCRNERLSIPNGPLMLVYAVMWKLGGNVISGEFVDANQLRRKKVLQMKPRHPGDAGRRLRLIATPVEWPANDPG